MDWEAIGNTLWQILTDGGIMLLKLIGVFILGYIIIRIVKAVVKKLIAKTRLDSIAQKFLVNTLSFLLYFALTLILIQTAGIPITGLLTAIAAAGLAVALALQDALTSLANGVILVLTKPFKKDDSVVINGISGKVQSINFFNTIIDTWDNRRIIIPNKNMISYQIENSNYHAKRRFSFKFKVSNNTDFKNLQNIVINAIVSNSKVFTDPYPQLNFREFTDTGITVEARAWANSEDLDTVSREVMQTVFNEIKKHKIEIANNSLIVYSEKRNTELPFENTPLPVRDLSIQPKSTREEQIGFEEYLDKITIKKIKAIKAKKLKKDKVIK